MSGFYNPTADDTLGLEWLVTDEPSTFVLDSAAKAYGQYMPGEVGRLSDELHVYAQAVSGAGRFGCQVLSLPYVEAIPQAYETRYAGTDTGADFSSPTNSNQAWLDAGGGVASYADVSPGVDDSTYLRNVNQQENPSGARLLLRGAGAAQWSARRVLDVEVHVRIRCTLATTPSIEGCLNLGGNDYRAQAKAVPIGQGYVDMTLGSWLFNPSTGKPWTLPEINNLVTTGATDEFGCVVYWDARHTTDYVDTIRISSVYLKIRWQPEDRCGYAYGDVDATGWHAWDSKSVPNLLPAQDANLDVLTGGADVGTWVADSNTTLTNDGDNPAITGITQSLKIDPTSSGAAGALGGYLPAIAGKSYAFRGHAKWTTGRNLVLSINFYDANGNKLQESPGATDVGTGSYKATGMTTPAVAPTGTTQMKPHIVLTAGAGTDTCFISGMVLGLGQAAVTYVQDSYPGGLAVIKVPGAAEMNHIAHPVDELRILRRVSGDGTMSLRTFSPGASAVGMPLGMWSYRPGLQDAAGALLTLGVAFNDVAAFGTVSVHDYDTLDGPIAAYSQPYAERITGRVWSGNSIKAELTLPAKDYLVVRVVVSGIVNVPGDDLVMAVRKTSGGAQMGGDVVIEPTDLVEIVPPGGTIASRTTPQVFVAAIPTPTTTTAEQYYVEASSAADADEGWLLYALDTMGWSGDSVNGDTIVFGAGVDAWINPEDGGEQTRRNAMLALQTQPPAPTNVTATVVQNRIRLDWDVPGVGALFDAMEVQREDDRPGVDDFGYQQMADMRDEAENYFHDAESRRGVDTVYRMRIRRTDGSLSEWSTPTDPVATPADECGEPTWRFVTNEADAAMYVEGQQYTDDTWGTPDRSVTLEFEGRDGAVTFNPLEDPLDEFDMDVALYWLDNQSPDAFLVDPPVLGRAAFRKLVALARAQVSYVCILDTEGERWYAKIVPGDLHRSRPNGDLAGGYVTRLHVRELQRIPSTPTTQE